MLPRTSWLALILTIAVFSAGTGVIQAADQNDSSGAESTGSSEVLRAGIIGTDTSHAKHFTEMLNASEAEGALARVKVTDAYPGGSDDIPRSADRVQKIAGKLREMGVTIHDSIPAMLENVDVVLLESVDGRPHLRQALPVIEAGKPVFIDKPLAGSLTDVLAIARLAEENNVPWFSSSSLRFSPGILAMRNGSEKTGPVAGADAWGPATLEEHHPDLFWYGIHGTEVLYTVMGTGCRTVSRTHTEGTDYVVGTWEGGRIGTFRGIREGDRGYGAMVFGEKNIAKAGPYTGYKPLVRRIADFFIHPDEIPVSHQETIEIYTFMAAADASKRRGGEPVTLEQVKREAQSKVEARLKEIR